MNSVRIIYAHHVEDEAAANSLARLFARLKVLLGGDEEHIRNTHMWSACVKEGGMHFIRGNEVVVLTNGDIAYPSRYLRTLAITPENEAYYREHAPEWAWAARRAVFINPNADWERRDKRTKESCFDLSLQRMHGAQGGYMPPGKRRIPYVRRSLHIGPPYECPYN